MDWFCWENLNRKPMGFYHQIDRAFRLKISHHPILWIALLAWRQPSRTDLSRHPAIWPLWPLWPSCPRHHGWRWCWCSRCKVQHDRDLQCLAHQSERRGSNAPGQCVTLDFGWPLLKPSAKKSSVWRREVCSLLESDITPSKSVKHISNTSQTHDLGWLGCGSLESKSALTSVVQWYSGTAQVSEHGNRPCQERAQKHVGSPAQQRDTLRLISLRSSSSTLNLRAKRQFHILFGSRTDGFKFQAVFSCLAEPVKNSTFTGTRTRHWRHWFWHLPGRAFWCSDQTVPVLSRRWAASLVCCALSAPPKQSGLPSVPGASQVVVIHHVSRTPTYKKTTKITPFTKMANRIHHKPNKDQHSRMEIPRNIHPQHWAQPARAGELIVQSPKL